MLPAFQPLLSVLNTAYVLGSQWGQSPYGGCADGAEAGASVAGISAVLESGKMNASKLMYRIPFFFISI
jgi:hypothetical protein